MRFTTVALILSVVAFVSANPLARREAEDVAAENITCTLGGGECPSGYTCCREANGFQCRIVPPGMICLTD
ncbi:hypothetical protein E1B28_012889 [Marasmius oreades]|uniref:Uncharacterized protein n=1 Tax=Marasmius oreades TaxID=181124 RepID=A0A9P7RSI5_9AGAR|nr:uncharacterized protein E1B28_012889 [Marasmius oreades]KAG7088944.1 hypothetical protein E1B28_012889 [Marasmius oreades]